MGKGATWGSYYHHGRSRFGERLCSGILCLLCAGPILTVVGLALVVSSATDTRTPAIHAYNDAVGRWVEGGGHATLVNGTTGTNVWFQVNRYNTGPRVLGAVTREVFEITDGDSGAVRARTYTDRVLRYTATVTINFRDDCTWDNGCATAERDLQVFIGALNRGSTTVRLPFIREEYRRSEDIAADCNDGDYWDSFRRQCVGYSILTRLCVKLTNTSVNGTWRVDPSHGAEGCGEESQWRVGTYERLRVHSGNDLPTNRNVEFQMRSTDDPRVQFFVIRGAGSPLNFGLTQGQKFALGAALLAVGGLITAGVLSCICCVFKNVSNAGSSSTTYQPMAAQPTAAFVQPVYQQPPQPVYPGGYPQQPYGQQPAYGQPQQPVYMGQQPGYGR